MDVETAAAKVIKQCWCSYRDRQEFKLLKNVIYLAEASLGCELIRKLVPREADFFRGDKAGKLRVRFRFGGDRFPPAVFFKLYVDTLSVRVNYVSGQKMIRPSSDAAIDAVKLMGNRTFYDHIIRDEVIHKQFHVTDPSDVSTIKDFVRYSGFVDELSADMGGKCNSWRRLTMDLMPRYTIIYDVIQYTETRCMSPRLVNSLGVLMATEPANERLKLEQLRILTELQPIAPPEPSKFATTARPAESGRRSKKALKRVSEMRRTYQAPPQTRVESHSPERKDDAAMDDTTPTKVTASDDEEANFLYEWTRNLTLDEISLTPRLPITSRLK